MKIKSRICGRNLQLALIILLLGARDTSLDPNSASRAKTRGAGAACGVPGVGSEQRWKGAAMTRIHPTHPSRIHWPRSRFGTGLTITLMLTRS